MTNTLEVFCRRDGTLFRVGDMIPNTPLQGFSEGRDYCIQIKSEHSRMYIDDAPLSADSERQYWIWNPGFYAGEVIAELEHTGQSEPVRYILDVSPHPSKTGRSRYFEYLQQIVDYAPQLLLGTEPAKFGLGGFSRNESPWIRYARLRCFIERYMSGLRLVVDRPCVRHHHRREQIPVHLARRIDATSVRRLNSNPALLSALAHCNDGSIALALDDNRIDVPFNEPTLDNSANRLILRQLKDVLRLVDHLYANFLNHKGSVSETETDIVSRLPRRLGYLVGVKKKLLKIVRNHPFDVVSTSASGVSGLNSVSGMPHYNMTYRHGTQILRRGISGLTDVEQHYLPPTWHIYESWCFVELAKQLESLHPDFTWQLREKTPSADMILEGVKGSCRIRLYAQMVCPSLANENRYGYCSISRERIPDFVLEYTSGDHHRFVCLDSKYMVRRSSVLGSMASAHIYRDSIKWSGNAPVLSLLLTPADHEVSSLEKSEYIV